MARSGAPQKRTNMTGVRGRTRPVDFACGIQLDQQSLMQCVPHPGLLPVAQPPPARDARAVAVLARQVLPRDPGVQNVQDPIEREAVIDRLATRVAATALADRDQRLDLGPQLVADL